MFVSTLFILSDYEVTQKVKGFRPVERFTVKHLFLLVVDTTETAIEYFFKGMGYLIQVCGLPIPLKYLLREEKGYLVKNVAEWATLYSTEILNARAEKFHPHK